GGGGRKGLIIGGVIGILAVGGAAFGAYSWLTSTGPQPAEALPADTLGYVSIDLDPSGSQKIAALKTLEKFPAADEWLEEEGIGSGDDIRKVVFGKIQEEEGACQDLDFDDDIKPWLGDRFAVAAIGGDEAPVPVGVVQIKDADDAQDRVEQVIEDCGGNPDDGGLAVRGDWLIIAETEDVAEQVVDDAAEASLADDEEFRKWTEAAGDPGILTAYASAEAGQVLVDELGDFGGVLGSGGPTDCAATEDFTEGCLSYEEDGLEEDIVPQDAAEALEDFEGMALTVRFDDGSLEVEAASGGMKDLGLSSLSSDAGGEAISTLPEDTAAAIGLGFEPGWADELLDYVGSASGAGGDIEEFLEEAESTFDLSLPEDLETLLGESAAIAVGSDFDPEAVFGSMSGASDLPIGAKVKGDTAAIQQVIDKVKATAPSPEEAEILSTESDDDYIVIGPDPDYLSELLYDGGLGDTDTYQDVIREDDPASIFFIDFDAGDGWLASLAGDDAVVKENLEPLAGLGLTGWQDDDETGHVVLRVTTD
ncbi:MAG: DUF3352 domain-containing protein, partial [Actinomycetota bacterium]|nr:DUF3352 domain-containing protein [Actinomycetota bacterium]